ncbi:hypothetical protein QAD02_015068 [Eretmocerus hayati]|uniref:Uncharacterized protein n=1 Tax=Eretmocerus hayati TaxID=131215 RepID=A0ACC2P770_9HYME|nr:hypothetical protein QAD02_015068 [Eretmocerus hayati]
MFKSDVQGEACEEAENKTRSSIYVFPNPSTADMSSARTGSNPSIQQEQVVSLQSTPPGRPSVDSIDQTAAAISASIRRGSIETPVTRIMASNRGHTRSASHGGVILSAPPKPVTVGLPPLPGTGTTRPSALKKPGHQRAFSQGQVVEVQGAGGQPVTGHSRVGSKTDFILPPGHRDEPAKPAPLAGKVPSFRGHSRQASRSESIYTIRRSAAPPWWRRAWARMFGSPCEEPPLRTILPTHLLPPKATAKSHTANGQTVDNKVRTTKYNTLTFLPRNLFEQFHRVANIYFIFIVMLNWVPSINAFGKEIAMIPVIFVLGVTALKDFFEDRRRLASDRRVNNSTCRVYTSEGNRYIKVAWKDVKVGDLIHLSNNEMVPADMLLLRSSDPQGFAYLDTCNLDGETNLKQRQVVRGFIDLQASFQPSKFRSIIEVDKPSTKIYRFHGAVVHPNGTRVPVSTENLLLRECLLKNTDFVEGIVVYVGHETKAMLNNGGPRYKRSSLERQMNLDVIWCVVILVVLCIVGAAGCRFWMSAYTSGGPVPFIPNLKNTSYEGLITFCTFVIILQVMIPLSLYVTIEVAKLGQVYHITSDLELYDPETNRTAECRALNITEELGQVQYIFSDKTGTLTENKMVFRRCAIGGQDYGHSGEGDSLVPCRRLKEDLLIGTYRHRLQEFLILLAICNTVVVNTHPHRDNMNSSGVIEEPSNGDDTAGYARLTESRSATPVSIAPSPSTPVTLSTTPPVQNSEEIIPMNSHDGLENNPDSTSFRSRLTRPKLLNLPSMNLPSMSLSMLTKRLSPLGLRCGSSPNTDRHSGTETPSTPAIYEAESPDELALVRAAKAYDVRLSRRTAQSVTITLPDKSILAFNVLKVLPFDSNRRCMSIIVKHPHSGEIVLYCKGADSTILSALSSNEEDSTVTAKIRQQLHSYARQGLRTLVMAKKPLTQEEYDNWLEKHAAIEASTDHNRERRIRDSFAKLETRLTLLGATGIEDKLQPGVSDAMSSLVLAGIVVWVLTGDKPETAVNIAYSAGLFSPAMQLMRLQVRSKSAAESLINAHLEAIQRESIARDANAADGLNGPISAEVDATERLAYRIGSPWQRQRALVVDGKTLTFILDPKSGLTPPFLKLTRMCSSVLACRATPLQKAFIVRVVKEQLGMRTLAIGDGTNDVSMIQTADVGIGVYGQEGTQAVMAADFAIARFSMLTRLLLVHGHWSYDRLSRMILYFFYKNATYVFLMFWYQLYCGFSGAVMIDQIYLMLYNLLFTSLPPLILGVYDQMAPANLLMESPSLYARGRLASVYQPHSFWVTMADALYQSIVIFFFTEAIYHDTEVDIWEFGSTITTTCIVVMLIHIGIEVRSWTIIHIGAICISLGVFFGFSLLYNAVCVNCLGLPGSYWVMQMAIFRHIYWLSVILSSVLAILPRFIYKVVRCTFSPDIIQRASEVYFRKRKILLNQRVIGSGRNELVAGWSRSTQDATIRTENHSGKNNIMTTVA